ncbi:MULTISPECIES: 2Fe-2S iron-sulfur cluster-binding protein [Mycobacteriaceae]|jgi:CDP-4-dehydro-6-deoxyglucose reductase|nr:MULTISPECIES: 2Fe-2S iron-sulfur cluster-binding protein [Mycobacteriaceae]MBI2700967.1 2Fe-2S iron-sulfur cluster binding domain-containing protein [Mycobacterium sp.]MBX9920829.1 2Fe-2S iron-sulfur cluster binding domain-containing protein [Mycolicibacterium frederiksbergense]MCV7275525.1 2Fe-2S iron-sulfur cluster binding domain-containing protein [Mycolicibacter arupensis]MBE5438364.1 hypothetical protein [Mycobacteroides abscessus]MBV6363339.1 2Fe-2S iron-sulfur cluster binding domain-
MSIIEIDPGGFVVEAELGETVLAAMRRHGIAPRSGCRRGGCSLCKADVVSGTVTHEVGAAATALTAEEVADGVCLPCRAHALTDCKIRLRGPARRIFTATPPRTATPA